MSANESKQGLGRPIGIKEAAELIGCSAWTLRQRFIPAGLPHLRSGPGGRLIFYENQLAAWIERRQRIQRGGTPR